MQSMLCFTIQPANTGYDFWSISLSHSKDGEDLYHRRYQRERHHSNQSRRRERSYSRHSAHSPSRHSAHSSFRHSAHSSSRHSDQMGRGRQSGHSNLSKDREYYSEQWQERKRFKGIRQLWLVYSPRDEIIIKSYRKQPFSNQIMQKVTSSFARGACMCCVCNEESTLVCTARIVKIGMYIILYYRQIGESQNFGISLWSSGRVGIAHLTGFVNKKRRWLQHK